MMIPPSFLYRASRAAADTLSNSLLWVTNPSTFLPKQTCLLIS